jgi:hypothetical protein
MVVLASPASLAAKPAKATKPPVAKAKKSTKEKGSGEMASTPAPGMEASKPSSEGYKYETPSPAPPPTPDPLPTSAAVASPSGSQGDKAAAATASPEKEPAKDVPPAADKPASSDTPTPVVAEELPVLAEPQPVYVEHLGPTAYPGKLRGIYGGSMWLEPSFNGLQWPYMARSGVGVSGSIWIDNGYEKITRDAPQVSPTTMWLQQGRGVLRVTPTYASGQFFIQGQIELVGNLCQVQGSTICSDAGTFDTDDLWIRFGRWNSWDMKAGRFEAWELYHTGMGLDINTLERLGATNLSVQNAPGGFDAPQFYGVNYLHDRPKSGMGIGYVAFHAYPTDTLRFEVLGELGTDNSRSNAGHNLLGGRPSVILDLGWLKLKAGAEYEQQTRGTPQYFDAASGPSGAMAEYKYKVTNKGFGGSAQFVFDPYVEFGLNAAMGSQASIDDNGSPQGGGTLSFTTISVGGFANYRPADLWLIGAGVNWTAQTDSHYVTASTADFTDHLQTFLAVQYLLARQLFIKAVLGYSRADVQPSDTGIPIWSSYMYSGRVRLMYLY